VEESEEILRKFQEKNFLFPDEYHHFHHLLFKTVLHAIGRLPKITQGPPLRDDYSWVGSFFSLSKIIKSQRILDQITTNQYQGEYVISLFKQRFVLFLTKLQRSPQPNKDKKLRVLGFVSRFLPKLKENGDAKTLSKEEETKENHQLIQKCILTGLMDEESVKLAYFTHFQVFVKRAYFEHAKKTEKN
jgi:hypothetical protein